MINIFSLLLNNRIKISIILPVYNAEEHLHKCIDSILQQKIKEIEIIAINDCSTDNSLETLKAYNKQDPRLKIINNEKNMGAGAARNNAIKISKGKYITFVDSDDWCSDNYLISLYKEAKRTGADIVFSNMITVEDITERRYEVFYAAMKKYHNSDISLIDLPDDWRSVAPWMKLFRKKFVIKNNIKFMENVKLGEDIPFTWISYFIAKKISFCENAFYYYNILPNSLDRRINKNILEIFDALEYTKHEYHRFDPNHLRYIQLDTLYISHAHYQFTKFINDTNIENIQLASIYWGKTHEFFKNIFQVNIMENIYLHETEKEYYYDVIKHPYFDSEMQYKYMLEKINEH